METENYIQRLETYQPFSYGMKAYLNVVLTEHSFNKNQRLSLEQLPFGHYPLLETGTVRLFAPDSENVEEITLGFWFSGRFLHQLHNLNPKAAKDLQIEFLQDTLILSIPEKHALNLYRLFREANRLALAYFAAQHTDLLDQLYIRNHLNAAERYHRVNQLEPRIQRFAQVKDQASFLGIDEKTLSRLRSAKGKK
ncbi:Crp/Fnr family transcriptional regulator [Pedobacter kyonggii]|uniref:Crp/Fnr family transcriptional regulator n=1 Tax=Pedobacter kyonggii TaxID=1926871 RepID=A0A4Q9HH81_9SPHI|nr:Crp/Fnr family transcriptional regulator [Pedobacter kyonggii]TBO44309.1 Crp/Fnr family transcriptional regulator [Pedobacter kyonggii]